jgi:Mrp family chromosome partitioning ATPase
MERISKALEKSNLSETIIGESAPGRGPVRRAAPEERIEYTQTRSESISRERLRHRNVIAGFDPCPFVDAYKVLRTKVLLQMREHDWNVLAVTGAGPETGTTLTAVNLAISLAWEINQTVLLVDANLRSPGVSQLLGVEAQYGLADYLLENTPVDRLLVHPKGIDRFVILPGGRPLPHSSEMLSSPRMADLVADLKHRYPSRLVLFDLPHIATSDTLAFAPYVDAALLVLEAGRTTEEQLQQAISHLGDTPLLGTVLNKVESELPN